MTPEEFSRLTGATSAQMADFEQFRLRLIEANAVMNLVGPDSLPDFWNRHAWDSAQLLQVRPDAVTWADLGAGAGFPGLVLAILLKRQAGAHVRLVDSLGKRCRFLQQVVDELALPASVTHARAEGAASPVQMVTARALAPLDRLLGYAQPWLALGAQAIFLKGERIEAELREAARVWQFEHDLSPSRSDPRGRLLTIRSLRRGR